MSKEKVVSSADDDYSCMSGMPGGIFGDAEPHTWDELRAIEARRRAILKRVDLPFWRILGYWDGTCLKVLVTDALLWISLAVYAAVRIQALRDEDLPEYLASLEDSNIDIIGGFLSFFLVLFVNQAQTRFNTMYRQSMDVCDKIEEVAGVVACYFPKANASRLVRYLNGAHAAGYVGLSDVYSTRSFFMELNAKHKFLTDKELERIVDEIGLEQGGEGMREILIWCIKEVQIMQEAKLIDARMSGELRTAIQKFRTSMAALYQDRDQPIHFFYIHFLSLLTAFYLPLFAIVTAYGVGGGSDDGGFNWTSEVMSGLIVLLQAVFVIGLRLLGQVMVDPYGDDVEDLSVQFYVQSTWKSSNRILATSFPARLNEEEETSIVKTRETLGDAWDTTSKKPELA